MFLRFKTPSWLHGWLRVALLNAVAGVAVAAIFAGVLQACPAYMWAWKDYVCDNVTKITRMSDVPMERRMVMKLGPDYKYLMFLRDATPTNAVIYYPTSADNDARTSRPPFHGSPQRQAVSCACALSASCGHGRRIRRYVVEQKDNPCGHCQRPQYRQTALQGPRWLRHRCTAHGQPSVTSFIKQSGVCKL